ncbi:MAG: DUF6151 family protein [Bdellovibrionia bacterium]
MLIPLKCKCGLLRGQVEFSRSMNKRIVCLCNDCQAYAHYLDRVDQMLDANGGTDIIPVHPAKIRLTHGVENLACVRLSDDGVYRWYAGCCKTPIANTPQGRHPYAGIVTKILDLGDDSAKLDSALGPVFARINGKYGIPPLAKGTSQNTPLRVFLYVIKFMLVGKMKGLRLPSPFTNPETDRPALKPTVLSDPEYYALIDRTGPKR